MHVESERPIAIIGNGASPAGAALPDAAHRFTARAYAVMRRRSRLGFPEAPESWHGEKVTKSTAVREEYRRLAERIAEEIQDLRREVESRSLRIEPQPSKAANDRAMAGSSERRSPADEFLKVAARRAFSGGPKWPMALASATAAAGVLTGVGLAMMTLPGNPGDAKYHTTADLRRSGQQKVRPKLEAISQALQADAVPPAIVESKTGIAFEPGDPTLALSPAPIAAPVEAQATEPAKPVEDVRAKPVAQAGVTVEATSTPQNEDRRQTLPTQILTSLPTEDCKRVQAALTALGYETPTTGYFGSITRSGIAAWQKTQGLPPTGLLDLTQMVALYAQAAVEARTTEQRKAEDRQAEAALGLSEDGRKFVQAALTAAGHETPVTGYFGPITRANIAIWQRTHGLPATGYLGDRQLALLRQQADPALAKIDPTPHL